jgi:hypothetical protein
MSPPTAASPASRTSARPRTPCAKAPGARSRRSRGDFPGERGGAVRATVAFGVGSPIRLEAGRPHRGPRSVPAGIGAALGPGPGDRVGWSDSVRRRGGPAFSDGGAREAGRTRPEPGSANRFGSSRSRSISNSRSFTWAPGRPARATSSPRPHVRPGAGAGEDPATGLAAAPLATLLATTDLRTDGDLARHIEREGRDGSAVVPRHVRPKAWRPGRGSAGRGGRAGGHVGHDRARLSGRARCGRGRSSTRAQLRGWRRPSSRKLAQRPRPITT